MLALGEQKYVAAVNVRGSSYMGTKFVAAAPKLYRWWRPI
jgi:hypothetical protein